MKKVDFSFTVIIPTYNRIEYLKNLLNQLASDIQKLEITYC